MPLVAADGDAFLDSLADTDLYSIGAFFHESHPELVDAVVEQAEALERAGLRDYVATEGLSAEEAFQALVTGLAVRYFRAVSG